MTRRDRDLLIVAAFTCLVLFPFLGKAFHLDEPFFLAIARQILRDPWHPFAFDYNWYGKAVPMSSINNTPPLLGYLLAAAYRLTGGGEAAMRLVFLPFDLAAGLALYLLAARFLKSPLLPALIVIASPAYMINMNHLMAEKVMAGFAFPCLYALVRGVEEDRPGWVWGSAALFAAALLAKYNAIFIALPAFFYLWRRVPFGRLAGYFAAAGLPLLCYLLGNALVRGGALDSALSVTSDSSRMFWSAWSHKLRSFLAFTGGCGVVTVLWPALLPRPPKAVLWACAAAAAVLFHPYFDLAPLVRPIDRGTGALMSFGAMLALAGLFRSKSAGARLWGPWVASVSILLLFFYWSILARLVLFLIPPLVFSLAEALEARWPAGRLRRLQAASLAGVMALSFALSYVDFQYADAQKTMAGRAVAAYAAKGRRLWCAAHWGLQHYIEEAGGVELDWSKGGWDLVKPGDVVVVTRVNSNVLKPKRGFMADVHETRLGCAIPLRLISGWSGEAGFYSNVSGFLPYSLSAEPLEEFRFVEAL